MDGQQTWCVAFMPDNENAALPTVGRERNVQEPPPKKKKLSVYDSVCESAELGRNVGRNVGMGVLLCDTGH